VHAPWTAGFVAQGARVTTTWHEGETPATGSFQDLLPWQVVDLGGDSRPARLRVRFGEPDQEDFGEGEFAAAVCTAAKQRPR
jgi:hypothetical protein